VFYYYEGINGVAFALDPDGQAWFVDCDGGLCLICNTDFDGDAPIEFVWESGYETFVGLDTKNIHSLEFDVYPERDMAFEAVWVTQHSTGRGEQMEVRHSVMDISRLRFDELSFNTAVTPIRLYKRIKTKRHSSRENERKRINPRALPPPKPMSMGGEIRPARSRSECGPNRAGEQTEKQ
jgi:hypothetical protein